MKLSLISIDSGVVRVATDGKITAEDLRADAHNPFEMILGGNWASNRVCLDLSHTPYIDSSAIGWLINSHKQFKAHGGQVAIHSITPGVQKLFELLKIGKVIVLAANEASAVSALQAMEVAA
jgi:anti-anti-sigma factor